ncbi:MAG: hypothetical protein ABW076_01390 [Candidatus Thiodiazotropha sp.]
MSKVLGIASGVLLVVSNGAWIYAAIDLAVTEKYRQQLGYEQENSLLAYQKLSRHLVDGMPKADVMAVLTDAFPEITPFEKDGCLVAGWIELPFDQDRRVMPGGCEP